MPQFIPADPTSPFANTKRDGVASIRELAQKMCVLVNTFGPLIQSKYATSPAVLAALVAAEAACTIVPALDSALVMAGENDDPLNTPELLPGINVNKPAAPAPDLV